MSNCRKCLLFLLVPAAALLTAVICIGLFYGTSGEKLLGPYLYYDIMPKTIYKINGQAYVPLTVDPESGKMADDIPYYIGTVSAEVQEFDFRTVIGPGSTAGKIEDDFLGTKYYDPNSDVYTVRASGAVPDGVQLLMKAPGIYLARIETPYSDHIRTDWEAYARELDLLFDTKTRQVMGDSYYLLNTNFKNSRYYYAVGEPDALNLHSFQKHLTFFWSDLKELL